ncbi:MAG: type II toxin-antitoxin system HigB family toxin [Bacteroidota bacterium]
MEKNFPNGEYLFLFNYLNIYNRSTINSCKKEHPICASSLDSWYEVTKTTDWSNPNIMKLDYPKASSIGSNRVVFDIKGNDYRLVVDINYKRRYVFCKWFGSHAEYDKINVAEL